MSEAPQESPTAPQAPSRTSWLDRAVWIALGSLALYRCVLPIPLGEPPTAIAEVRVATAGKPVMVVFDGSR